MNPFFSIITPSCDVEPYVRACLDSILNQSFQDWECLIGVETSKDNTEAIVREYASKDARFKVFTGERSGSCSASRNTGTDMATGEYVIFLDGDDTIVDGSLQRLHDQIAARPGADLYPCAMYVHNETTGQEEPIRDNYPKEFHGELTGRQATMMAYENGKNPCPMLQMTVFRRLYLIQNNLKCVYGLRRQDSEFSPRALYLAEKVIPLHEIYYVYRIRSNSVSTSVKSQAPFLRDYSIIFKSLLNFHAKTKTRGDFDSRISSLWATHWLTWMYIRWFSPRNIRMIPRALRAESIAHLFGDGFGDFDSLLSVASFPKRIAGAFMKLFARHPSLAFLSEMFFIYIYFPLTTRASLLRKNRGRGNCSEPSETTDVHG